MSLSTIPMSLIQYLFIFNNLVLTMEFNCVIEANVRIYVTYWLIHLKYSFRGLGLRFTLRFRMATRHMFEISLSLTPYFGTDNYLKMTPSNIFSNFISNVKVLKHLLLTVSLILETKKNMFKMLSSSMQLPVHDLCVRLHRIIKILRFC